MTYIWKTLPLLVLGGGAAWFLPTSAWFVVAVQLVIVLVIAPNMTYVWKTMPLLAAGAGAVWFMNKPWFVLTVQVIAVLLIALGAMVRRWNAD